MTIDTLAYAKTLEAAGVERHIAEAHAEAVAKFPLPDLAGKSDIERLESGTKTEIGLLKADIRALETRWTVLMWAVGVNLSLTIAILGVLLRIH